MKLTYRPEIDGLRAVAVIAVILYHARITILDQNFFQGGFIGVDIFLVISGYLITSLILKELNTTGNFSFLYFYQRRARRILPALFFIMLASLPLAWVYLLPTDYVDFSKSILYSIGFSSNFYFHFTGLEYGALEGLLKPFLHTWSLSVEEQYYIVFPVLLLIIYKLFKKNLLILMLIALVISFFIASWTSVKFPSASFYFLHTRMWELLAGSILAYLEIKNQRRWFFSNKLINRILTILGIILIGHAIVFYNDDTLHPSAYTLTPIIGVCLIIWFAHKDEIITKIFSSKIFVGTGLISYSLYLWHYPVFALFRYSLASGSLLKKILIIIFIILASIFTFFFVERPFRNRKKISVQLLLKFLFILVVPLILVNIYVIKNNGFDNRYVFDKINLDNGFYLKERQKYNSKEKISSFEVNKKKKILIIGNSHGQDTFNIFKLNEELFTEYQFSRIGVEIFCLESFLIDKTFCNEKVDQTHLNNFANSDVIVLSTRWRDLDKEKLEKILINLKKSDKKIILTTAAPEFKTFGRFTMIDKFILSNGRLPNENEIIKYKKKYYNSYINNKSINSTNKFLKLLAMKNNVRILDKELYLCNHEEKICEIFTNNGEKINFDRDHYTIAGAKYLGNKIYKNDWFKIK